MRRLLVFVVGLVLFSTAAQDLSAQPLRDLFNAPRGRVFKELFGDRNQNNQNKQAAENKRGQQPTPADPRSRNNNRPTAAQASQASSNRNSQNRNAQSRQTQTAASSGKLSFGAKFKEARNGKGIVISQTTRNGVAAKAGLKSGDVITKFGGIEVAEPQDLESVVDVLSEGDQIEVEFKRNGKSQSEIVSFGEPKFRPELENAAPATQNASSSRNPSSQNRNNQATTRNANTRNANTRNAHTGRLSSNDYAPIKAPNFGESRNERSQNNGTISVLSDFHRDSTPTPQVISREKALQQQVTQLQQVVRQQQQVIQNLQNQIKGTQRTNQNRNQQYRAPQTNRGRTNFGVFNNR